MSINAAELKAKYLAERDKRVTALGTDQYRQIEESSLRHYIDDPYVKPISRPAITEEVDFLIVGAGFGGQLVAGRLVSAGITNIRMVDRAGDFGGTWYWNRYPGAACDIEAYVYMPLCEELNYVPTEKYTRAPELFEHARNIGRHYGLYEKTLFQTEVVSLDWDETAERWTAKTDRGDAIHARFVTTASGPLQKPKLPGVPGIETFKGHSFHTSRWDYDYTGGDTTGGLNKLADKRVGIIGTGATAVQSIPHLGLGAKHLYVFQRTPSSVDVRLDRPTDTEWAAGLKEGWQKHRMDNFNNIVSGAYEEVDLVSDGWTDILRNLSVLGGQDQPSAQLNMAERMQMADFMKMNQIRDRIDRIVEDPKVAAALKPWYNQMCKRPCFHNNYLPTFNRPNVTLVDTDGRGIERITENGIVAGGKEYELDCIIYATGFEFGTDYSRVLRATVTGRNKQTLGEKWADKIQTFHGLHTRGFPNLFVMGIVQSGLTPNFVHMLNEQGKHIAYIVSVAMKNGIRTIEASKEAEEKWVETILELGKLQQGFVQECTPGYYNNEGKNNDYALSRASYGLGSAAFIKVFEAWRATNELPGLECNGKALSEKAVVTKDIPYQCSISAPTQTEPIAVV
ncbi:hypothetical protein FQN57_006397 [Myotisia sp. PD_48]|nr:hypothetical protein FQN57_006397 [Myotisia sp. PD_48]